MHCRLHLHLLRRRPKSNEYNFAVAELRQRSAEAAWSAIAGLPGVSVRRFNLQDHFPVARAVDPIAVSIFG